MCYLSILELGIIPQVYFRFTPQTIYQPFINIRNKFSPSKSLVSTPLKSYKMFFQNVTHSIPISVILFI
jgi:hypothetical protein